MPGGPAAALRDLSASLAVLALLSFGPLPSAVAAGARGSVRPAVLVTAPGQTARDTIQRLVAGRSSYTRFTAAPLPSMMAMVSTDDRFAGFAAALRTANVADVLETSGPFTLFLPSDQAFSQVSPGMRQRLVDDPDTLAGLVRFHLVPGRLSIEQVESMSHLATVQGSTLAVSDISVVRPGIEASNGVIHVVDRVLNPPTHAAGPLATDSRRDDHHQPRTAH